jgi:hypothetical protein
LFGYTDGAEIRDIQVDLPATTIAVSNYSAQKIGILVGYAESTAIVNCGVYSSAGITVIGSGLIVGVSGIASYLGTGSVISNCYAALDITVTNSGTHAGAGGISADDVGGTITNCYFAGAITANCGYVYLSGIGHGTIQKTYIAGALMSNNSGAAYSATGGITLNSTATVGGCAVLLSDITHANNANYARIQRHTSSAVAALSNNYAYSGMLLNGSTVADDATNPENSQNGLGKTAAELKQRSTYETGLGWDFSDVWEMGPSSYPYPIFKWQNGVVHVPPGFTVLP